jgi:hypothetical protein
MFSTYNFCLDLSITVVTNEQLEVELLFLYDRIIHNHSYNLCMK